MFKNVRIILWWQQAAVQGQQAAVQGQQAAVQGQQAAVQRQQAAVQGQQAAVQGYPHMMRLQRRLYGIYTYNISFFMVPAT